MLQSFLVYTITAVVLAYLGWHANAREQRILKDGGKQLPFYCWEIVVSVLLFAFVAGARFKTGYDHWYYMSQYWQLRDYHGFTRLDYEPGFILISKGLAAINTPVFIYFAFWGALQYALFLYAFRNNKSVLVWVPLIIMLGGFFVGWMNSIRQVVVECAFVAMVPMCKTWRNTGIACIVALFFASIHSTALLIPLFLLMMWWLRRTDFSRRTLLIIYGAFIILGVFPIWLKLFSWIPSLLKDTHYEKYIPMFSDMVNGGFRTLNWGPTHILMALSHILVLWYYPEVKKYFKDATMVHSFFVLSFVGMCLTGLLSNTSHFVLRPIEYLTLCTVVVEAFVFKYLFDKKKYSPLVLLAICTMTITYLSVAKAVYLPDPDGVNAQYLYNFIFTSEISPW